MRFQNTYNSIKIHLDRGVIQEMEIAVNIEGEGLFVRVNNGNWQQWRGTGQFHAYSPAELVRRFQRDQADSTVSMIRGSAKGWKLDPISAAARALRAIPSARRSEQSRINGRKGGRPRKNRNMEEKK